ncbi:MAG TPA: AraC family transcriptional regulator ligand-binding domain-containing protein, partial [Rhizomicrobium sp.]|nr:AraC family transcriptional regulator ligand-binding domain-containing protein [Rhizomicrobium sp.]
MTTRHAADGLSVPTINLASVVFGLEAYMRERGGDAQEALRRAGLEPGDLIDPDRRVPLIRYLKLLEICADVLGDPQFGLKFGARYE